MKIIVTNEAFSDMRNIYDYIAADNAERALKVWKGIEETIDILYTFPNSGFLPFDPILAEKGYRILISGKYLIYHIAKGGDMEIRAVVHGSMDSKNAAKKLDS
jgi:plasmid stabilization system protein ParE